MKGIDKNGETDSLEKVSRERTNDNTSVGVNEGIDP